MTDGRRPLVSIRRGRSRYSRRDRRRVYRYERRGPNRGDVAFALQFVRDGSFGELPQTIHEKAFHLLRLLVANHPFVDGNKRTALNTTTTFYLLNGYRFEYDNEIRTILKQFGTDAEAVDEDELLEYLRTHTTEVDLTDVIAQWRGDLVEYGLGRLSDDSPDPND